ncbi:MAG: hypothetical protein ABIJ23_04020 [Candidatus Magasanikbacteria bacterium]
MDKIEKLLRKINKKQREQLLQIIERLLSEGSGGLNIKKIKTQIFIAYVQVGLELYTIKTRPI